MTLYVDKELIYFNGLYLNAVNVYSVTLRICF